MSDSVQPHRRQPTRLPHPWDSPGKNTGVGCHFLLQCMKVKSESEVTQSYLTLSDPMDCNLPGSSVHGIFRARVLEWGAIAFSDIHLNMPQIFSSLLFIFLQFFPTVIKAPLPTSCLNLKSKRNFGFFPFLAPYFQSIAKSCHFYLKNIASAHPLLSISVTPYSRVPSAFPGLLPLSHVASLLPLFPCLVCFLHHQSDF